MPKEVRLMPAQTAEQFCYLITTGRVSGKAHEVEMWFAAHPDAAESDVIYCLSGGRDRSDWVKNLRANPVLDIRLGDTTFAATGRIVEGEAQEPRARQALAAKYYRWTSGELPNQWAKESLPVAVRLEDVVPT